MAACNTQFAVYQNRNKRNQKFDLRNYCGKLLTGSSLRYLNISLVLVCLCSWSKNVARETLTFGGRPFAVLRNVREYLILH
jgi:hypothetical protein